MTSQSCNTGCTPEKDSNESIYFNNNVFGSDTIGDFKGSVFFVQNSIIPSKKHIDNDIQPHLVSKRKTMVLFKSYESIDQNESVYLHVKNRSGNIIYKIEMRPPEKLTSPCGSVTGNYNESDFSEPLNYDVVFDKNNDLNKISNDPSILEGLTKKSKAIKILTSDGNWAKTFTLLNNQESSGAKITFKCNSGYNFSVFYAKESIVMSRGDSLTFANFDGVWCLWSDIQYSKIKYIENGWSGILPASFILPGIEMDFVHGKKIGSIKNIKVGAPNELLLHTISIGMLTPYRKGFAFQDTPEFNRQYFQQVPLSRLIVSRYDPIYLKEVMLPDGRLLTDKAPGNGGVHSGIMREDIAKDLIATGIDFANYGINSTKVRDSIYLSAQITVHLSIGKYDNGTIVHGLSGGNGMATLENSIGNEFSHEIGHNYGLGHYPGGFYGSVDAIPSHRNSTWGWDSDNDFFIPNFHKKITNKRTYLGEKENESLYAEPFHGHQLGKDAMAGGEPLYMSYNAFTLHTPYVLNLIQKFLESKMVFDTNSITGFSKWNDSVGRMEPYENNILRAPFFSIPFKNGENITIDKLNLYLQDNNNVDINSYDGKHSPNIYIPKANNNNNNKVIKVVVNSSYSVKVINDGNVDTLSKGSVVFYVSNGSLWQQNKSYNEKVKRIPYKQGVKVITLVGFYDPESKLANYIYPALNGSYGMVYPDDASNSVSQSYLEVEFISGKKFKYNLNSFRITSNLSNKFHVNVERDLNPRTARLFINNKLVDSRTIDLGSNDLIYTVNGNPLV